MLNLLPENIQKRIIKHIAQGIANACEQMLSSNKKSTIKKYKILLAALVDDWAEIVMTPELQALLRD